MRSAKESLFFVFSPFFLPLFYFNSTFHSVFACRGSGQKNLPALSSVVWIGTGWKTNCYLRANAAVAAAVTAVGSGGCCRRRRQSPTCSGSRFCGGFLSAGWIRAVSEAESINEKRKLAKRRAHSRKLSVYLCTMVQTL